MIVIAFTSAKEKGQYRKELGKTKGKSVWLVLKHLLFSIENANKTGHSLDWESIKCLDSDFHWFSSRVKDAILIRLYPNNINKTAGSKYFTPG